MRVCSTEKYCGATALMERARAARLLTDDLSVEKEEKRKRGEKKKSRGSD